MKCYTFSFLCLSFPAWIISPSHSLLSGKPCRINMARSWFKRMFFFFTLCDFLNRALLFTYLWLSLCFRSFIQRGPLILGAPRLTDMASHVILVCVVCFFTCALFLSQWRTHHCYPKWRLHRLVHVCTDKCIFSCVGMLFICARELSSWHRGMMCMWDLRKKNAQRNPINHSYTFGMYYENVCMMK